MVKLDLLARLLVTLAALSWTGAASAGTWQPVGIGDCPGRDVAATNGPVPDASRCDASFAGQTAVCWTTGCRYKSVATAACTGGATPGQMYTCMAAPPAPVGPSWQPVGLGDCPGRDVAASSGSRPVPGKCTADFVGNTAVCWSTGCSYKNVATGQCFGGTSPGHMYTCAAAPAAAPVSKPAPVPVPQPAPVPVPQPAPAPAPEGGAWRPLGVGDCPGYDVAGSRGPYPEPSQCHAGFAGKTAICWSTGCTYKSVTTAQCAGGPNPGQMYTCTAAVAAPAPVAAPPATSKLRGKRYSVINFTGDKQSKQDFLVDWKGCRVAGASPDVDVTVDVCRSGSRLVVKSESRATGQWIRYDWVVLDDGATLAGSYRDATTCGPSVGKRAK